MYEIKTALITGATSGFGMALAKKCVQAGVPTIAVGRRPDRLSRLKDTLGPLLHPIVLDVRDRDRIDRSLEALPDGFRQIELLVNNAGLARGMEPAQEARIEEWDEMVDINCKGAMYMAHAVLPGMLQRKKGHIINLGSTAAEFPYPGGNVYGATKAFIRQFSLNLRADLVGTPIRVTDIEPGLCSGTEFSEVRFRGDRQRAAAVYEGVAALTADDIAETIIWAATLPSHVNINLVQLMPVQQAFGQLTVHRGSA